MRCPHCQAFLPDGSERCEYCGASLSPEPPGGPSEPASSPSGPSQPSPNQAGRSPLTPPYPWREGPGGVRGGTIQKVISWLVAHAWWIAGGVLALGLWLWALHKNALGGLLLLVALAVGCFGLLRMRLSGRRVQGAISLGLGVVLVIGAVRALQGAPRGAAPRVTHQTAPSGPHLVGVTAKTVTLHLDGNQPWTDSGLYLLDGDTVRVVASGTINNGSIYPQVATNGPNGQGVVTSDGGCTAAVTPQHGFLAPGLPCWALIARVGTGEPFWVGTNASWTVHTPGELWFGVNNNVFGSSHGAWTVTVTVSHPA